MRSCVSVALAALLVGGMGTAYPAYDPVLTVPDPAADGERIPDETPLTDLAGAINLLDCGCQPTGCSPASCCPSCCCCPCWTVTADAMFLRRSKALRQTLLLDLIAPNTSLLDARQLSFDCEPGIRLNFIRHGDGYRDLEVGYFMTDGWHARANVQTPAMLMADRYGGPPVQNAAVSYRSELHNVEINLCQYENDWLTPLIGLRYAGIGERYHVAGQEAGSLDDYAYNINVANHLYGVQAGAKILVKERYRFRADGVVKAGLYANAASEHVAYNSFQWGYRSSSDKGGRCAFIGELGINLTYDLTEWLALRGTYQIMWIEGVALAPNQIPTADISGGPSSVRAAGGLFYYGAQAGIEAVW